MYASGGHVKALLRRSLLEAHPVFLALLQGTIETFELVVWTGETILATWLSVEAWICRWKIPYTSR